MLGQFGLNPEAPAKRTDIDWQTFHILLVKRACAFGHRDKHRLTSTNFQKHFLLLTSKKGLSSTYLCSGQTDKHRA